MPYRVIGVHGSPGRVSNRKILRKTRRVVDIVRNGSLMIIQAHCVGNRDIEDNEEGVETTALGRGLMSTSRGRPGICDAVAKQPARARKKHLVLARERSPNHLAKLREAGTSVELPVANSSVTDILDGPEAIGVHMVVIMEAF